MKVWIISGMTESGDDIGPYVLDYEPTELEMHEIVKADMPEEYKDWENNYADLPPERYDESDANPSISEATILSKPELKPTMNAGWVHESHDTRFSDSSHFDEVCKVCGATDANGKNGPLSYPCKGYDTDDE